MTFPNAERMRDAIRYTIGTFRHLIANLPAILRSMCNPQFGVGYKLARFGLAIFSISKFMPKARNRIVIEHDVMLPMRDDIRLCADVFRPTGEDRYPTLVIHHPYGRYLFFPPARQFARQGFAVVHVDERGRFRSEGDWYILRSTIDDGHDLCKWIIRQPWSNGQIGGWGSSMLGINQWRMSLDNPLVTAISPNMGCLDVRRFLHYGGAKPLSAFVLMGNWIGRKKNAAMLDLLLWLPALYNSLPIAKIIHPSIGKLDWIEDHLTHDSYDPFFEHLSCDGKYGTIRSPALNITGWYDMFCDSMIEDFRALRATGTEAGQKSRLVIGPWGHYWAPTMKELDEYIRYSGLETLKWYEHRFQGKQNGVEGWPVVRYYVTGVNTWRSSGEWPPAGTRISRFYLRPHLHGNSSYENGLLSKERPENTASPNTFIYNPADPVPTTGGDHLFFNVGRKDQARLESREDVLVYRTPPLESPLEFAGPVRVVVQFSTDAPDTDLTAKLVDVGPEGKAWNLRDGIVRLKYRNFPESPMNKPSPVEPGKVYELSVDLGHMSHQFRSGHRIGLHLSSSNFPKYDRNLNTGEDHLLATTMRTARQNVFSNRDQPSYLEIMVVSSAGA